VTKPWYKQLYIQVLIAVALGILVGYWYPQIAIALKPLGDGFIKLIRMLIAPIIFLSVVSGIAGMSNLKSMGRVGGKALLYFEIVSTLALVLGMLVVNFLQPGDGFNVDPKTLDTSSLKNYTEASQHLSITDFLLNIIPQTPIDALAKGDMLSVLFFAILFGIAISLVGEKAKPAAILIESLNHIMFRMVSIIMLLAPIGAFGAMAFTVGKYGIDALAPMAKLMGSFYLTCIIFITVILGLIAKLCGFSLFRFLLYLREELLIVLGTSSSETVLPRLMEKCRKLGCAPATVGLVVPTGYSFNLDGTNIYMAMAAIFIAQATNTDLSLSQQLLLLGVAMLSSKGAAGVTGSGFITLAATLAVVPSIPVAGMVLILGIDRFMSEARAITNFIGNGVATIAISRWESEVDMKKLNQELQLTQKDSA
jgi:aerobic C4-dicarboxylate transport protein